MVCLIYSSWESSLRVGLDVVTKTEFVQQLLTNLQQLLNYSDRPGTSKQNYCTPYRIYSGLLPKFLLKQWNKILVHSAWDSINVHGSFTAKIKCFTNCISSTSQHNFFLDRDRESMFRRVCLQQQQSCKFLKLLLTLKFFCRQKTVSL